jgi:iron(III) transport system substrate-binding protein
MRYALTLLTLVLASCGPQSPPEPVVVHIAGEEGGPLSEDLEAFTEDTGALLDVRWGKSEAIFDALIENSGDPADVLITDDVADIWRAADRGALRPIQSAAIESQPAVLRDPDRYWATLSAKPIAIYHHNAARPLTVDLVDLGSPEFAGRLCLSSSALPVSRMLIGLLVHERGNKETERLVRRWVRNLAMYPHDKESQLLQAVASGECEYGLASTQKEIEGATAFLPQPHLYSVTVLGVGRHANNPSGAEHLVDWLLGNRATLLRSPDEYEPTPVHVAGWRDEEARLLAERAGYR